MIEIDIKHKSFGSTDVLRDINLTIEHGETLALLGPSGIGKTTLLRIVAGLDTNFDGSVQRPDAMAMVFQEPTLLPWRTAIQNITLTTGVSNPIAEEALNSVGLMGKGGFYPNQLSLGQQRRLSLARAFAQKPELLIMDEPFASLDDARVKEMVMLSRQLIENSQVTTLIVTHSESEAEAMADRIIRIDGQPARLISA